MAPTALDAARSMYRALQDRDIQALTEILDPAVRGAFSADLPFGLGGVRVGAQRVVDAWAAVARHYDIAPYPQQFLHHSIEVIVATGRYRGRARETGHPLDAAFAHVIEVYDGKIRALTQFTDTASWLASTSG